VSSARPQFGCGTEDRGFGVGLHTPEQIDGKLIHHRRDRVRTHHPRPQHHICSVWGAMLTTFVALQLAPMDCRGFTSPMEERIWLVDDAVVARSTSTPFWQLRRYETSPSETTMPRQRCFQQPFSTTVHMAT
jgi:hypothetical protein